MVRAADPEDLVLKVRHADDGVTVHVGGVFDAPSVSRFSAAVSPLLYERRQPPIELDVSRLRHLSGSGLGAIVFAVQFARGHGQVCRVTGATGQPETILRSVALTLPATVADALGGMN